MPIPVTMPALSPTMEEGTVTKWFVKEGDSITSGDVIAEVETDKATMEIEAVEEGTVGRILVPAGSSAVAVNRVIAVLLEEGEDNTSIAEYDEGSVANLKADTGSEPVADKKTAASQSVASQVAPQNIGSTSGLKAVTQQGADGINVSNDRLKASPLARRMAAQAGVNLSNLNGSGPNGRIVKSDVEKVLGNVGDIKPTSNAGVVRPVGRSDAEFQTAFTQIPNTTMRRTIARRLTESKQTIPHFYLSIDCEIDELLTLRKTLNKRGDNGVFKLSINDFVISASALALSKVPAANASWTEDAVLQYKTVDIAIAVAIEGGLITPVIRNADHKGLAEISNEMKELAKRAQANKLLPEEYQGGTFSISNLGMYGIREFAAVINPPQGAILAVGAGEQRPVVTDGALSIATVMTCTLSCDHRVVDGAVGAEFLSAFKGFIQDPLTMML